jgi:hypothetical protein
MNPPPTTCHYCPKPAVAYCDFPVNRFGLLRELVTCDRAICEDHCRRVGHICARGRNKKLSGTIDYCKEHHQP